jgi:hypothetical protein
MPVFSGVAGHPEPEDHRIAHRDHGHYPDVQRRSTLAAART